MRSLLSPRWVSQVRLQLARRPWIYWVFVVGVAGLVAVAVSNAIGEVRRERDSWGATTTVVVARTDIQPGDLIAAAVETRVVPIAMAPATAVRAVVDGATARQRVAIGEIVVDVDMGPGRGPLALLPDGWLAVTFDDVAVASFVVGDRAVVLAAGATAASEAVVIDVRADAVVIGVPAADAAAVAEMVAQRLAVIALSNGR